MRSVEEFNAESSASWPLCKRRENWIRIDGTLVSKVSFGKSLDLNVNGVGLNFL